SNEDWRALRHPIHAHTAFFALKARLARCRQRMRRIRRWRGERLGRGRTLQLFAKRTRVLRDRIARSRTIGNDGSVVRIEITVCSSHEIVARCREQTLEIPIAHSPVAKCLPFGEIVGLAFHVLEATNEVRLVDSLRALDFEFTYITFSDGAHLIPD